MLSQLSACSLRSHAKRVLLKLRAIVSAVLLLSAAMIALAQDDSEFIRLMNHGKALLENRESAKAIEALTGAVKLQPRSAAALRNLARAYLLADKPEEAIQSLARAASIEPDEVATPYLTGLAHAHL